MVHPRHASAPGRVVSGRRLGALAVVVALFAGACSGDDDSPDAATAATTIPPDTTAAPATTTPATTAPAPTTVPQTTVASTTTSVAPTTAPDSVSTTTTTVADPEVQAVVDGLIASWTAFNEIKLDPLNDDKLAPVAETYRGELLEGIVNIIEELRIQGRRSVTNPEVPARVVPLPETAMIDGTRATIEYCWVNSNIFVETQGNADGTDRVIDDSLSVSRVLETFELVDGRWLNVESLTVVTIEGEASCEPVL